MRLRGFVRIILRAKKADNTSLRFKVFQRNEVCVQIKHPRILECFGGYGVLYDRIWRKNDATGAVIEKDAERARHLAEQRQKWVVVRGDCEIVLQAGFCDWLAFDILDCDPYGEPWKAIRAFFGNRVYADAMFVVATDGLVYDLQRGARSLMMRPFIEKYGREFVKVNYGMVAEELLTNIIKPRGFEVRDFKFHKQNRLAHWTAKLERVVRPVGAPV